jgi:hypothetical protein
LFPPELKEVKRTCLSQIKSLLSQKVRDSIYCLHPTHSARARVYGAPRNPDYRAPMGTCHVAIIWHAGMLKSLTEKVESLSAHFERLAAQLDLKSPAPKPSLASLLRVHAGLKASERAEAARIATAPEATAELCRDFNGRGCRPATGKCKYRHEPRPQPICADFTNGRCWRDKSAATYTGTRFPRLRTTRHRSRSCSHHARHRIRRHSLHLSRHPSRHTARHRGRRHFQRHHLHSRRHFCRRDAPQHPFNRGGLQPPRAPTRTLPWETLPSPPHLVTSPPVAADAAPSPSDARRWASSRAATLRRSTGASEPPARCPRPPARKSAVSRDFCHPIIIPTTR